MSAFFLVLFPGNISYMDILGFYATEKTKNVAGSIKKHGKTGMKTAETDSNSVFTGLRAKASRLQISVTWLKKVKYGKLPYQIFKFWQFSGIRKKGAARAKK